MIAYLRGATLGLNVEKTLADPEHRPVTEDCPVVRTGLVCTLCGGKGYLNSFGLMSLNGPCPQCQERTK